jgi:hypothetical protein
MESLTGLSWNDKNAQRNYPFMDNSNLTVGTSGFIPNDLIVDARIYIRGCYEANATPYVSRLELTSDRAVFKISCNGAELGAVDIPYVLANLASSESNAIYTGLNVDSKLAIRNIMQAGISSGMLIVNLKAIDTLQSVGEGAYTFTPNQLQFVPFACEYLPGPQVTSVNGLTGNVILRGEEGIRVEKMPNSDTDIKISIVGDPHFTRYDCINNPQADDLSSFLEELVVIYRGENRNWNSVIVKVRENGSSDFSLKTKSGNLPLSQRPAFRITVAGNTINLSLAGR